MPLRDSLFSKLYTYPYGYAKPFDLYGATKNDKSLLQRLRVQVKIPAHNGCVNSITWNESGKLILSGSDDYHICLTHGYTHSILMYKSTGHRSNIFSAKFLPGGDNRIVSCSGDGVIIYTDMECPDLCMNNKFDCHFGTAYKIVTIPQEPNSFLSCGEDGTVRWFDLRTKTCCARDNCKEDVLIDCCSAVTGLSVNTVHPYQLAVGCADSSVRLFDRRMICTSASGGLRPNSAMNALMAHFTVPTFTSNHRITSLTYSQDGQEILVSYSSDFVYLFDVRCSFNKKPKVISGPSKVVKSPESKTTNSSHPLMKRLRVRGDWSDTGPYARPESEIREDQQQPRSLHASLVQRMSDVLTNMYNSQRARSPQNVSPSDDSDVEEIPILNTTPQAAVVNSVTVNMANLANRQSEQIVETINEEDERNVVEEVRPPSTITISDTDSRGLDSSDDEGGPATTKEKSSAAPSEEQTSAAPSEEQTSAAPSEEQTSAVPSEEQTSAAPSEEQTSATPAEEQISEAEHNVSFQNIRQEMSKKTAGEIGAVRETVIKSTASVLQAALEAAGNTNPDVNSGHQPSSSEVAEQGTSSGASGEKVHLMESSGTVGDNRPVTNVDPTVNCDVAESPGQSENSNDMVDTFDEPIGNSVPNIYIAPVSGDESVLEANAAAQGEVTVMMEMDSSWDLGNEEAYLPNLSRRRELLDLDIDSELTEKELKKAEQDRYAEVPHPEIMYSYTGHRNARTMIKEATFWGDKFVMSGSDCGHIFVWDRETTELIMIMEADHHVVNCLQPHPFDPILASSGIDYDIKLWAPLCEEPFFDEEKANELIQRNHIMLEETRDTITVPASFMIRMLASLNHVTAGTSGWRRMARHIRDNARRNR